MNQLPQITLLHGIHKHLQIVRIIPPFNLNTFFTAINGVAYIDYSDLKNKTPDAPQIKAQQVKYPHRKSTNLPKGYLEMLEQKRKSQNTIRIYTAYMKDFVYAFKGRGLETIAKDEINTYIHELIKKQNISPSQQNQRINAIKFYYEKVLKRVRETYQN